MKHSSIRSEVYNRGQSIIFMKKTGEGGDQKLGYHLAWPYTQYAWAWQLLEHSECRYVQYLMHTVFP